MRELGIAIWLESVGDLERAEEKAKKVLDESGRLSRTWMQQSMVDLLATIAARRGDQGRELADWLKKKSGEIGFHPGQLPQGEAALAAGDYSRAFNIADSVAKGGARIGVERGRIIALELGLRALAELARWGDLLKRADSSLREAEQAGFRTRTWRILGLRARAREAQGDSTGAAEDREAARAILLELASTVP
jgi:hypothetical protein